MIKNVYHNVNKATSRNELIDLLNSKCTVIEVTDSLLEEFNKEYSGDKFLNKGSKAVRNLTGLTAFLGLFNPATTLPTILFMAGTAIFSGLLAAGCDFKNYAITSFSYYGSKHTVLIRYKKFNDELDTIQDFGTFRFSKTNICPKCQKKFKINKNTTFPITCEKCGAKVVVYVK